MTRFKIISYKFMSSKDIYKEVIKILNKIIFIKITTTNFLSRCYLSFHIYPFVKFNFICAIKYRKIIEYKLYEKDKGGINNIKFTQF